MFKDYLKLWSDLAAAWAAKDWLKVWDIEIEIQRIARSFFPARGAIGLLAMGTVTAEEYKQLTDKQAEVKAMIEASDAEVAAAADAGNADAARAWDGKLIAWIIKIGLNIIGIPLPFESKE